MVALELGEYRYERLEERSRPDPERLARELPPATAATLATLRAVQRTVARLYGFDPGRTDMEAGIEGAAEVGADVALVDDPIAETLSALAERVGVVTLPESMLRAWLMGPRQRIKQFELLTLPFRDVRDGDDVQGAIDHLRWVFPDAAEVLIDDRDRAMARRLHALRREGRDVVAVVGAGHHNGILAELERLEEEEEEEEEEGDADSPPDVPMRTPARTVTRIEIE